MFGNAEFYHTFSFTLNSPSDVLDLKIEASSYGLQIDEVYLDDSPDEPYSVEYLNVSSIGQTNLNYSSDDLKRKLFPKLIA